jgi:dTDP-4-dehydrorhamnose reductase
MKKLLVTGGSGYLGQHLLPLAAGQFELVAATHRSPVTASESVFFDLTSRDAVERVIFDIQPDAIIHAAALNPGQGDEALMMRVNADGSRWVAQVAAEIGARLVHVSTDVVHDGRHAPYSDDAPPTPLNGYGRSKAAAEAAIREECPDAAIVRTSLIYGLQKMDRGTAGFVERLQTGEELVLFADVIRQPVWVDSLAVALLKLVNLDYAGLLNVVGREPITRAEFGRKMLRWWGIDAGDQLKSGRAADISATIPLDVRLTIAKAETLLQMRLPGVNEVLALHKPYP